MQLRLARSTFMELLLNLAWLLLALPAYWLWRESRTAPADRKFTSLQCLLALGCMLVILFPVISATDDLLAMRSEMEESPVGKRSVHQASHEKASDWKLQSPPALTATATSFLIHHAEGRHAHLTSCLFTPATPAVEGPGRAPPYSLQA
jgi:hypothetical protein